MFIQAFQTWIAYFGLNMKHRLYILLNSDFWILNSEQQHFDYRGI